MIVVEHDEDTILAADHVIDIGPGAGMQGGEIVATGTPKQIEQNTKSLTGQYLSRKLTIDTPEHRRGHYKYIELTGAKQHNLKTVDLKLPLSVFSVITGVSGSGKSTLIHETLYKALMQKIYKSKDKPGTHDKLTLPRELDKVILVDQSPIGRTPRSNPATYTKLYDDIRALFAATKESKLRGYQPGRYTFNVPGGRCENCHGEDADYFHQGTHNAEGLDCTDCHMHPGPGEAEHEGRQHIAHVFLPNSESCTDCHAETLHLDSKIIDVEAQVASLAQTGVADLQEEVASLEDERDTLQANVAGRLIAGLVAGAIVGIAVGFGAGWLWRRWQHGEPI